MGRCRDLLGGAQERRLHLKRDNKMMLRFRGFTLIELLIAVAIFAFLIMLAGPQLAQFLASSQVRNAAEAVYTGVQKTQSTAVGGNAQTRLVLDKTIGTGGWQVLTTDPTTDTEPVPNPAGPCLAPAGAASINPVQIFCVKEGASDVTLKATPNDATQITFDGLGRMQCNADGTANLKWVKVTNSKNASARTLHVCITDQQPPACPGSAPIAASQIKLCDPNVASTEAQACPDSCK